MSTIDIERINNLTPAQLALLKKKISFQDGKDQLVAYVIPESNYEKDEFRNYLSDKLPDYMIPSAIIELGELPKLANGKVDYNSLPEPAKKTTAPKETKKSNELSKTAAILIKIWEEVLDFAPINADDNFFEIGGDSILSIQIVSKARKLGLKMAPNLIFDYQTIAKLSKQVSLIAKETDLSEHKSISGNVPLTPIQHWFFEEHNNAPAHWNQSLLIKNGGDFHPDILKNCINQIISNHDGLRLSFYQESNEWKAKINPSIADNYFQTIRITDSNSTHQIQESLNEINSSFNLAEGNLFRAIYFQHDNVSDNQMVLVAHHLIVDSLSWGIIIDEIKQAYQHFAHGKTLKLSSSSFGEWANKLSSREVVQEFEKDLTFWKAQQTNKLIVTDHIAPLLEKEIQSKSLLIDQEQTNSLLKSANDAFHSNPFDLMLLALQYAIQKSENTNQFTVGIEKHGRKFKDKGIDLSETIGWLTAYFPLKLNLNNDQDIGQNISDTKENLRNIPNDGISYGILRYLSKKDLLQKPEIIFNYLGNTSQSNLGMDWKPLTNGTRSELSERHHYLEINASIRENKFELKLDYAPRVFSEERVNSLLSNYKESLLEIISYCENQKESQYTSSDFPDANLSNEDLKNLFNQI